MMTNHQPSLTFDVKFVNMTGTQVLGKARELGADDDLLNVLSASPAVRSARASATLAHSLFQEMKAAGITGEVARNDYTGEIKALVRDPAAFQSAVSRGRVASASRSKVKIETFSGIQTTAVSANLAGGQFYWDTPSESCTTGFNIMQPLSGVYGVTTAGHCTNSPITLGYGSYQSTNPRVIFVGEWTSNSVDLQWGYVVNGSGGVNFTVVPRYSNGLTNNISVSGAQNEYPGIYICKYGKTTNITCGYVDPYAYTDSYGDFSRVNRAPGGPVQSNFGDSGGPVYFGSLAVGTVHGKDAAGNMYFTPYRKWQEAGVNINIICYC